MKDFKLIYRVTEKEGVNYSNQSTIEIDNEYFRGKLENGILTIEMKISFNSSNEAKILVDKYLRSWEIYSGLIYQKDVLGFTLNTISSIEIADHKNGKPPEIIEYFEEFIYSSDSINFQSEYEEYPKPTDSFTTSPDVETLWYRFKEYLENREPLLSMAYFCITFLENKAGNRRSAASQYGIEFDILENIGELSSTRGDVRNARKAKSLQGKLKHSEIIWIVAAIAKIIQRLGEYESGDKSSILKMGDLPII